MCTSLLPLPVGYALYTYDVSCRGVCVCVCVYTRGVRVYKTEPVDHVRYSSMLSVAHYLLLVRYTCATYLTVRGVCASTFIQPPVIHEL